MDKGWSWVTMLAAFGTHFSCGGLQYTVGFIRIVLLQNAGENEKHYITWITSMYAGMISLSGPIASFIVYKYGCRTTVIIGASMEVIGFIICFFTRNIWIYLISYSLLADVGSGLTLTAVLVLLSFNFDRYLSFASGMAVSGQGVGLIVMPMICNFIYEKYGLQPTFIIIAGIILQKWVLAALMRPSSFELDQLYKSRNSKKFNYEMNATKRKGFNKKSSKSENGNNDGEKVFCSSIISDIELTKQEKDHKEKGEQFSAIFTAESGVNSETSRKSVEVISDQGNISYNFDEVENTIKERHIVGNTSYITSQKKNDILLLTVEEIKEHDYSNISKEDLPTKYKTVDISTEFSHDNNTKSNSSVKMAASLDKVKNRTRTNISYSSTGDHYFQVVKNRKFIFLLLGGLLYSIPEETIYMLYPDYALTNGSSQSEMSNLLSIIGISSTISRLLMGVTANSKIVDIYILFAMPFVLLGVATLLLPYYVHAFAGRVFYAIVFGLYNCGMYSLTNEIVTKITGKDNVPAAFGFLLFRKGIIGIFAPSLAGSLYIMCLLMIVLLP